MERWSSGLGFVLAAVGAAVGLGNIWRFSAVVGQNGGGAYLVAYLFAAFAFALPLLILEIGVGRELRLDVVAAFESIRPGLGTLGWAVAGSVFLILSYYLVLTGWVLAFFLSAVAGGMPSFRGFTATYQPVAFFVVATLLTGGIVSAGVRAGIERMSTVVMPVVVLLLLGLAGYVTTLSGFGDAVAFLLIPDFSVLGDPLIWSAAFGQVFFSLSVGQGIMLTYGSYLDEGVDLGRSGLVIAVADIAVAFLAGLVIFPVVFTFGLEPTLGTELAFTTLPEAFASMPFGGVIAVAFFGLLFLAALTSSVSLLEVGVAAAMRSSGRSRRQVAGALTGLVFLAGLPSALSYSAARLSVFGVPVLDLMDETVGSLALPVTAFLIAAVFTWLWDADRVRDQVGPAVLALSKYVIPVVLVVVVGVRLSSNLPFPAWGRLPGARFLGTLPEAGVTVLALLVLLVVGRLLVAYVPARRRRRGARNRR